MHAQGVGAGTARNPFYEIWTSTAPNITRELPLDSNYLRRSKQNYYPFNYVLPNGLLFNWSNRVGYIMDPWKSEYIVSSFAGGLLLKLGGIVWSGMQKVCVLSTWGSKVRSQDHLKSMCMSHESTRTMA